MNLTKRASPVTSHTLKLIAIITMAVDHAGTVWGYSKWGMDVNSYLLMRRIGRIAFPIFAFLLVEGFTYTRNRRAYLRNLLIFALISEIPFDLALTGWDVRNTIQNVFWTLILGLLGLMAADTVRDRCGKRNLPWPEAVLLSLVPMIGFAWLGGQMRVDYGFWGVLLILLVYGGEEAASAVCQDGERRQPARNLGAACGILFWMASYDFAHGWLNELYGAVAVVPILLYNGERGRYRLSKWFFYGFYPVHLLILYLLRDTLFRSLSLYLYG